MPTAPDVPQFTVVGHITCDLVAGHERTGGTASYAAVVASRLGLRTALLTSAAETLVLPPDLAGVDVHRMSSARTTTLEHVWHGRVREQYLRARADAIPPAAVPNAVLATPIVLFGPLVGEVSVDLLHRFPRALRGATLQGWLRTTGSEDHVEPVDVESWDYLSVLNALDAAFLSLEDIGNEYAGAWSLLERWARAVPLLGVTLGEAGARLAIAGRWHRIGGFPSTEVDPTGAGDTFAAAFVIRYHETADAREASRFAAAVASFVVEAPGISGAPSREQVEARLAAHPAIVLEPE